MFKNILKLVLILVSLFAPKSERISLKTALVSQHQHKTFGESVKVKSTMATLSKR
jgi:hypothetical protein